MHKCLITAACFLLMFWLSACQEAKEQKVLRLAHSLLVDHSVHKAMVYMGEVLEQQSGGGNFIN